MKRLVTLGITLALVMGLFCFTVNAETVVQGTSDSVTATYGSNNITIALKARKLRVINTGTAAAGYAGYTPVIVTISIYNLGDQNCLINNLKFQLMSDSAEYTIAGCENLSTDLFVAESAYDSNGYLSIHASNDYTYSGGIVCPANTNMTYVGIINVSANWITENQTWRTVDLSSSNFYSNMTTTVGDYPCAAEPVDLSDIETYLSNIDANQDTIDFTTSEILDDIRNLYNAIVFTGQSYSYVPSSVLKQSFIYTQKLNGNPAFYINLFRTIGTPYIVSVDVNDNSYTDLSVVNGTIRYPVNIKIALNSLGNYSITHESFITNLLPTYPYNANFHLEYLYSPDIGGISFINNNNNNQVMLMHKNVINKRSYYKSGYYNTYITGYIDLPIGTTISWPVPDLSSYAQGPATHSIEYLPPDEYTILRDLYLAYSSVNGIDDLSDAASDASDQAAAIHNQEASYYAQNQAAIEATGLSNYQFSGEQSNGIGAVSNDFTALWNVLGSWNSVYIFSMTLTLALTILRHVPNRRKPKEKNSE